MTHSDPLCEYPFCENPAAGTRKAPAARQLVLVYLCGDHLQVADGRSASPTTEDFRRWYSEQAGVD